MEDQSLLDWSYFCHGKTTDELTQSLLLTTMELEASRLKAEQQLNQKDHQLNQLNHLLNTTIKERDEAQNKYQTLLLQIQTTTIPPLPPYSAISSIEEDEPLITINGGLSSSDCEESILSSSPPPIPPKGSLDQESFFPMVVGLPEKGKLLEAVIKAGPLLQNLMLAGPLPHWRHPPPPLDTYQIPPPPLPIHHHLDFKINKKRGSYDSSSSETKYQRIAMN